MAASNTRTTQAFRIDLNIKLRECTRFGTNQSNVVIWGYSQVKAKLTKTSTPLDDVEEDLKLLQTTAINVLPVHIKSMWGDYDLDEGTVGRIALALIMRGIFESKEMIDKEFADIATLLALSPNDERTRFMMAKKYGEFAPTMMLAFKASLVLESRGRSRSAGQKIYPKTLQPKKEEEITYRYRTIHVQPKKEEKSQEKEEEKSQEKEEEKEEKNNTKHNPKEREMMDTLIGLVEIYFDMTKVLVERSDAAMRFNENAKNWAAAQIALSVVATGLGITTTVLSAGTAAVAVGVAFATVNAAVNVGKNLSEKRRNNQGLDEEKTDIKVYVIKKLGKKLGHEKKKTVDSKGYVIKTKEEVDRETVGEEVISKMASLAKFAKTTTAETVGEAATELAKDVIVDTALGVATKALGLAWNVKQFREIQNFVPMLKAGDAHNLFAGKEKTKQTLEDVYGIELEGFRTDETSWSVIINNLRALESRLEQQKYLFYGPCLKMITKIKKILKKMEKMNEKILGRRLKELKSIQTLLEKNNQNYQHDGLLREDTLLTKHVNYVKEKLKDTSAQWSMKSPENPMSGIQITKLHITHYENDVGRMRMLSNRLFVKSPTLQGVALIRRSENERGGRRGLDKDGRLRLEFPIFENGKERDDTEKIYKCIFNTAFAISRNFNGNGIQIEVLRKDEAIFTDKMKELSFTKSDTQEECLPGCVILNGREKDMKGIGGWAAADLT